VKFWRFLIILLSIFFSFGYIKTWLIYAKLLSFKHPNFSTFTWGLLAFIPVWFFFIRKLNFIKTFFHEFAHLVFDIISFHKPGKFFASENEGGYVYAQGSNFLTYLSPYFFPTLIFLLLPFFFIIEKKYYPFYFFVLGVFASFHILISIRDFFIALSSDHSDFTIVGKVFSIIFVIFANIVTYGFLLTFVLGGFPEGWLFLKSGVVESFRVLKSLRMLWS